ncbi:acetolactate decarboxylase [Staphylococcus auricularis]|nr:acetolactate decarboxylase [Staphylococcus auricularis]
MGDEEMLYQHGTLADLMAGMLQGTASINDILEHGDLGIGTLSGSDGEVIILDGKAYHANAAGDFRTLTGEELTPFATITPFKKDTQFEVETGQTSDTLQQAILDKAKSKNLFLAVKVSGQFKDISVRMLPKQDPPYTRLKNSAEQQPEYTKTDMKGTIVGFYAPQLFHGIASGGFHLHFIDDDKTFGGHVLDFNIQSGTVELHHIETLEQHFPIEDPTYLETDIDYDHISEEINEVE